MSDLISRQAAIELVERMKPYHQDADDIAEMIANMPPAEPDYKLKKIADVVDGTIDHFDYDDAMDALYQIKGVLKDG